MGDQFVKDFFDLDMKEKCNSSKVGRKLKKSWYEWSMHQS